ncbi:MAG TPA: nitrophenyl compound nitroreductase subunit ArsF family protein [Chitinophagaceae bacterium]
MRHKSIVVVLTFFLALFAAPALRAQGKSGPAPAAKTEVLQFHLEHRCATCLKIEKLTRATLASYFKDVPFTLVNVEKKENGKMAEQFGVYGTALFLYNPATGKKNNLTELAFLKVGNEAMFTAELKKQVEEFLKG